jgi:hypothetical protein
MNTVAPIINTSIEYIKGFNPLNSSVFKTISGFSLFRSKPKDVSGEEAFYASDEEKKKVVDNIVKAVKTNTTLSDADKSKAIDNFNKILTAKTILSDEEKAKASEGVINAVKTNKTLSDAERIKIGEDIDKIIKSKKIGAELNINEDIQATSGIISAIIAVAKKPNGTTILNLIMVSFYYILIIMLASFVANGLIFAHWGLRLFSFLFVLYLTKNSPILVYPLAIYYIIRALRNGYINFRDKLSPENKLPLFPTHYAILPIITGRGSKADMFPIFYFSKGHDPKDPKYYFFKRDESKHKAELDSVVPGIQQIKGGNKTLVKNFANFLEEINRSYIKLTGPPKPPPMEDNAKAERDAIEQHITGTISKTTGDKAADYIKTLGKIAVTPLGVAAPGVVAPPGAPPVASPA